MAKQNFKEGDWIEKKGSNSGLWFDGEIKKIEGNEITIVTWGWLDEPQVVSHDILRPISPNNTVTIRKGGSVWAVVDPDGTIRINGSISGSINMDDGTIHKAGSIAGKIQFNGVIYKNGSETGAVWPSTEIYRGGSVIGGIDNKDGTIRLGGSIWGGIDDFTFKFRDFRTAFAVLVFFAPEFGY